MFFAYCRDVGDYHYALKHGTRITTELSRTRKWAQKTKKTFDHVQIWRIPVFRESHVYLTVFLPEETTSDTSFFSVWAINPMTLKIGNPPNRLVIQLIEDTTTASLGTMKQRNSDKFTMMIITIVTPWVRKVSYKTSLRLIATPRQFADGCRTWTNTLIKGFIFICLQKCLRIPLLSRRL